MYVLRSHGSPICPKRIASWDFGLFVCVFKFCYVLLSFLAVYHGIRDGQSGERDCWVPQAPGLTTVRPTVYHGCQYVPSRPVTFYCGPSRFSRSGQGLTRFTFCQGFLRMKRERRAAFTKSNDCFLLTHTIWFLRQWNWWFCHSMFYSW